MKLFVRPPRLSVGGPGASPGRRPTTAGHDIHAPASRRHGRHEGADGCRRVIHQRSEEHTSELQSLMRISYAVFCLKKKKEYISTDDDAYYRASAPHQSHSTKSEKRL